MKLALFGVGNAGTRIVDEILEVESTSGRSVFDGNVVVFNTQSMEEAPTQIPADRQIIVGDMHPDVTGAGVEGDPDLGADVANADLPEIRRALDGVEIETLDAAIVVAGLGGGTGGGVGSVVLEELVTVYEKPVYVLGVLPAEYEADTRALTAARTLKSVVPRADNVLLFDNGAWSSDEADPEEAYDRMNEAIATRFLSLFAAGEFGTANDSEMKMDPSDLRRTLETGGVSTIGYATLKVGDESGGFLAWLRGLFGGGDETDDDTTDAVKTKRLIKRTLTEELTLPCDVSSADRVLLILSGPPEEISRKGFESGRYWLEQQADTVEILAGDEPLPGSNTVGATVLLSNVTTVPQIEAIKQRAVAVKRDQEGETFRFGENNAADDSSGGAEADSEAEGEADVETEPEPEAEAEAEAEAETETETETEAEAESEPETDAESESEAKAEQTATETKPKVGDE